MVSPFVLVEGMDVSIYASLDELTGFVEAQDVRDGVYEAFDAEGLEIKLAAASDSGTVIAASGARASDRLRARLTAYIAALGTDRIPIEEADIATVDLASLIRSVATYQSGGRPPSW
jgi:hypothetical protein